MAQMIIIGCYLGLLLILGVFASRMFRGTSQDYMLASHSIGPFLLLMSLFGTTMTAFALIGSTGESFELGVGVYGMLASSSGIVHSLCFFVLGVPLWKLGYKYGYSTQIQFFRDRFDSDKLGLLLFPVLVGLVIPYLLIGVMASGGVINGVTQGDIVMIDGVRTVAEPTFAEGTFPAFLELGVNDATGEESFAFGSKGGLPREIASFMICCVVLIYVFVGGMRGTAWANAFQTIVFMVLGIVTFYVIAKALGQQDSLLANMRFIGENVAQNHPDKLDREGMSQLVFLTYMFVPLSVGMFPHLFQHWLTARSANSFKLPVVAHPIFIMIVWLPCVLVGVWATSGLITIPAPIEANPNLVLPFMVRNLAGPILGGFLTAGVLAAIMSSLDSQFLAVGTMFTEDVVVHYGGKNRFSDKQIVLIARLFIIGIVAVTYFFSLYEPRRVFVLGVWCFSGFSSLFPLIFAALYWKRMTKAGAYACVITAIASWIYLFSQSGFGMDADYVFLGMMPVATMIACSTTALVVVSLLTRPPGVETLAKFFPQKR
jgi:solute:Na+ symporter, SSS family